MFCYSVEYVTAFLLLNASKPQFRSPRFAVLKHHLLFREFELVQTRMPLLPNTKDLQTDIVKKFRVIQNITLTYLVFGTPPGDVAH